jgi:hypothetical protein
MKLTNKQVQQLRVFKSRWPKTSMDDSVLDISVRTNVPTSQILSRPELADAWHICWDSLRESRKYIDDAYRDEMYDDLKRMCYDELCVFMPSGLCIVTIGEHQWREHTLYPCFVECHALMGDSSDYNLNTRYDRNTMLWSALNVGQLTDIVKCQQYFKNVKRCTCDTLSDMMPFVLIKLIIDFIY